MVNTITTGWKYRRLRRLVINSQQDRWMRTRYAERFYLYSDKMCQHFPHDTNVHSKRCVPFVYPYIRSTKTHAHQRHALCRTFIRTSTSIVIHMFCALKQLQIGWKWQMCKSIFHLCDGSQYTKNIMWQICNIQYFHAGILCVKDYYSEE